MVFRGSEKDDGAWPVVVGFRSPDGVWFADRNGEVRVEEHVGRLEEERRKIEAFKKELPVCLRILNQVIDALKNDPKSDPIQCISKFGDAEPSLEEFLPCSNKIEEEKRSKLEKDEMNWLSLSSPQPSNNDPEDNDHKDDKKIGTKNDIMVDHCHLEPTKVLSVNGLLVVEEPGSVKNVVSTLPDLSLQTPGINTSNTSSLHVEKPSCNRNVEINSVGGLYSQPVSQLDLTGQLHRQQSSKKTRRNWSPELHRKFVNVLEQLGGLHATPKQIRELMRVDGLTNDEVKSHLQKYRLHQQRSHNCSHSANSRHGRDDEHRNCIS